jgi:hypothetical protein
MSPIKGTCFTPPVEQVKQYISFNTTKDLDVLLNLEGLRETNESRNSESISNKSREEAI